MTIEKIREGMLKELDFYADEYGRYQDEDIKKNIAKEYQAIASGFNCLIRTLYGNELLLGNRFPLRVWDYIEKRNSGKWVTW